MLTAPTLRPYQHEALDELRDAYRGGARAPLLALPTGAGKTIVFAAILAGAAAKGRRTLVLAHRRELIRQAGAKLLEAGVEHGFIAAGFPRSNAACRVASVQTLVNRLDDIGDIDLVVIDEAHHAVARTYRRVLEAMPNAKLLGVTATPLRLDGKGLGTEAGGCFDTLVVGASIKELTDQGYLAPCRVFAPKLRPDLSEVATRMGDYVVGQLAEVMDSAKITGDAVEHYQRHASGKAAIAFCVSIDHAEHVASSFVAAGFRAKAVSGMTPAAERDAAIAGLANGAVQILTSCDLISEGLDVPGVEAVILLRPTKSLAMFLQQIGRGMRPAPGKDRLVVLDHAGNCLHHGLPEDKRAWSLDGKPKEQHAPTKPCPECGTLVPLGTTECPECGHAFPTLGGRPRELTEAAGTLQEIDETVRRERLRTWPLRRLVNKQTTVDELREIARLRGYRRGWVAHMQRDLRQGPAWRT